MSYFAGVLIAAVTGAAGYIIFPFLSLEQADPRLAVSLALATGAIIGSIASSLRSGSTTAKSGEASRETIYVGNLAFKANRNDLQHLFSEYGDVHSVRLMTDRETRRSRGYGFIEMDSAQAKSAIKALNGDEFMGRTLKVNIANERKAS